MIGKIAFFMWALLMVIGTPLIGKPSKQLNEEFVRLFSQADEVVIEWQWQPSLKDLGIDNRKLILRENEILSFASKITFPDYEEVYVSLDSPGESISLPRGPCACSGTHLIVLKKNQTIVAEIQYKHFALFSCKLFNDEADTRVSGASLKYLNERIGLRDDLQRMRPRMGESEYQNIIASIEKGEASDVPVD